MQIVTSPPKKLCLSPYFLLVFWSAAAAAELWLAFRCWCRFKNWYEPARRVNKA